MNEKVTPDERFGVDAEFEARVDKLVADRLKDTKSRPIDATPSSKRQSGWLLEWRGHSGVYFSPGWRKGDKWEWITTNHDEAVRFAREEDANRTKSMFRMVNSTFFQGPEWVATEHVWMDALAVETRALQTERDCYCLLLSNLVRRLDEIHDDPRYKAVWESFMLHGGRYTEPTYTEQLEAARAYLQRAESAEKPELLHSQILEWASRIERAYGELPSDRFPGPPTNIVEEMRNAVKASAPQKTTSPCGCDSPHADYCRRGDLMTICGCECHGKATVYETCSRCGGSGLGLNMAGEPDECPQCKGNAVCAQNGTVKP